MGVTQIGTVSAVCAALILPGCSVANMRGAPAQTRAECHSDWLRERQSNQTGTVQEAVDFEELMLRFLYSFAAFTTAPGVADARYRSCLERLGVTNVDAYSAQNRELGQTGPRLEPLPPRRPAHCPPGASVLYGGAGYCVGR
ncbi:hypothetical protein MWU61_06705 [Loktanella sp. F6476L]|uniref:hypothetical protein n=1 Tax=Loktanella sp. F6476L TaxID=2926405 RepID=UPI001FF6935E|nr:hypothetical protein [Loktanella sp. F6476L]MCK0120223.1 hypothetical protein [Loktanella sp. F6476L]